ncbi:hypothetical protein AOLI_G00014650 [Acnodon oligacanthus]
MEAVSAPPLVASPRSVRLSVSARLQLTGPREQAPKFWWGGAARGSSGQQEPADDELKSSCFASLDGSMSISGISSSDQRTFTALLHWDAAGSQD